MNSTRASIGSETIESMKFGLPQPIQVILAMIFVPPFALVSGVLVGVILWFLLADAGLPTWARAAISILVIPGLPGLWFVAMPILFWRNRVTRLVLPEDVERWQSAQFETMEHHHDDFDALRRQRIKRVVAGGMSATAKRIEMTVVAVELGTLGGVITVVHSPLDDLQPKPPDPDQVPDAYPFSGAITHLTDDVGTDYIVLAEASDHIADHGRVRIDFIPAPPSDAGELRLTMSQLYVGEGLVLPGPWEISVPLR